MKCNTGTVYKRQRHKEPLRNNLKFKVKSLFVPLPPPTQSSSFFAEWLMLFYFLCHQSFSYLWFHGPDPSVRACAFRTSATIIAVYVPSICLLKEGTFMVWFCAPSSSGCDIQLTARFMLLTPGQWRHGSILWLEA